MALIALGTCTLLVLGVLAGIALRTYHNLDLMIVDLPRPTPARIPTPTATLVPAPTATPASLLPDSSTVSTPVPTQEAPTPLPPVVDRPATILVLGVDRRPDENTHPHTDAIIVVHLDPVSGQASMLSLPRDLWVSIPGFAPNRINTAYATGEAAQGPGGGPALACATVSMLLGIPIDAYVLVDFQGFIGLIDALGGISVDVERELYDSHYPTMDYGYQEVYFAPGRIAMDGATALIYSRIRHPDSDFHRIRRQQQVLTAIFARLGERGTLRNLLEADRLTAALRDYVRTDLPHEQVLGLLWALRDLDPALVRRLAVSAEMVQMGVGADLYAEVPDLVAIQNLAAQLIQNAP